MLSNTPLEINTFACSSSRRQRKGVGRETENAEGCHATHVKVNECIPNRWEEDGFTYSDITTKICDKPNLIENGQALRKGNGQV